MPLRRGKNFERYMTQNCYFFAPDHLKPLMLALLENGIRGFGQTSSCMAMVNFAKAGLSDSMQPWFDAQFASTQALANSIDYLLSFVSEKGEAGRYYYYPLPRTLDLHPPPNVPEELL